MEKFKKFVINLTILIVSPTLVLGAMELGSRIFLAHKVKTYFDEHTEMALGSPVPAKSPGEYRIFILGGSAAYGFPASDRYSITAWMNKSFPHLLPGKKIRVINCGWPGKASHQVLEGARTLIKYQPDL